MTQIQNWLKQFKKRWKNHETDKILNLFTEDVEYWETPTQKLNPTELHKEWQTIKQQQNIQLETEIYSSTQGKHTIQWQLTYQKNGQKTKLNGIYLIKLNSQGKCHQFHQYCQSE